MDVFLNLYDLYKILKFTGYTKSEDLFNNKIVELVISQKEALVPKIRFNRSSLIFCPFLENELTENNNLLGRCKIHPDYKPLICKLSPIAREVDLSSGEIKHRLVEPAPGCPGMDQPEQNDLSIILNNLVDELEFEDRYYNILESLGSNQVASILIKNIFFNISTKIPFEETLSTLQKQID
jgi:Fe-S-cluster containining protein